MAASRLDLGASEPLILAVFEGGGPELLPCAQGRGSVGRIEIGAEAAKAELAGFTPVGKFAIHEGDDVRTCVDDDGEVMAHGGVVLPSVPGAAVVKDNLNRHWRP